MALCRGLDAQILVDAGRSNFKDASFVFTVFISAVVVRVWEPSMRPRCLPHSLRTKQLARFQLTRA